MAQQIYKSSYMTNRDARPQIPNDPRSVGRLIQKRALVTAVAADSATSQYGFFDVRSDAIIEQCALTFASLAGSSAMDLGFWESVQYQYGADFSATTGWSTTAGGYANAGQYFGAAIALASTATKQSQLIQSSWTTIAKMMQPLWQILGFATDPGRMFDLVGTVTTAITTGGAIVVELTYRTAQS